MPGIKLYTSKKWMKTKYVEQGLTEQKIAELANTSQATINRWLRIHGLK